MGGSSRCRSQFQHFWGYAIASRRPTQFEFLDGCRLNFAKGWCICWDGGIIRQQLTACHQVPHTQELLGDSVLQNNVHTTVVGLLVGASLTILPHDWNIFLLTSVSSQSSDSLVCGSQVIPVHACFSLISQPVEICLTVCLGFGPKNTLQILNSVSLFLPW